MLYAYTKDGQKIRATKKNKSEGINAYCPLCDWPQCEKPLIYKPGKINASHFAHPEDIECDPWSRGKESEWHLGWKKLVNKKECEVTIEKNGDKHRADIQNKNGLVIELQNSSISFSEIHDREKFYDNMIWLFNGRKSRIYVHEEKYKLLGWPDDCKSVTWKNVKKTILYARKRIFIDLDDGNVLYLIKNINGSYWVEDGKKRKQFAGYLIKQSDFVDHFLKGKNSPDFQHIHDALAEDSGHYFEQQQLFHKYFKWLLDSNKKMFANFQRSEEDLIDFYFSERGSKFEGDKHIWNNSYIHYWGVRDFIEKYPQYEGNRYFLFKTIKLGIKLGWYKLIKENKLKFTQ